MTGALWYVATYSIVIGVFMVGWWSFALVRRLVPEAVAGSREIWFHIAAELVTGSVLVAGGVATLLAPTERWTGVLVAIGLGLVVYSLIASPGYYVERGERPMVVMFATIWLFTIPALVLLFV